MAKIDLIIPVKNVGPYIYNCLRSCIYNDYDDDINIIVVNDGSTDNTLSEVNLFQSHFPNIPLLIINTDGIGPGAARNLASSKIKNKYVAFIDGDDLISRKNLSTILNQMDASGAELCCPNIIGFDDTFGNSFNFDRPELRAKILGSRKTYLTDARTTPELLGLETSMCMRICRADFYHSSNLSFSEALFCEDVLPSRKAILHANKILITSEDYYYYRLNRANQRTSSVNYSTIDLNSVIKNTMDLSLNLIVDNDQGCWMLNRMIEITSWGVTLLPSQHHNEYISQITDTLERAPTGWWRSIVTNPDIKKQQKRIAQLYLYGRNRHSRERIILTQRQTPLDAITVTIRRKLK